MEPSPAQLHKTIYLSWVFPLYSPHLSHHTTVLISPTHHFPNHRPSPTRFFHLEYCKSWLLSPTLPILFSAWSSCHTDCWRKKTRTNANFTNQLSVLFRKEVSCRSRGCRNEMTPWWDPLPWWKMSLWIKKGPGFT